VVADHLSSIPNAPTEMIPINEDFLDEHIFTMCKEPWYADITNYLATGRTPSNWSNQDKHRFLTQIRFFFWDEPYLFKYCPDQIIRRCLPEDEHQSILTFCHELACRGTLWSTKDCRESLSEWFLLTHSLQGRSYFCKLCAKCQMMG